MGTRLFTKPLLSNGYRIFAYSTIVAQQRVYMLRYIYLLLLAMIQ
jgi:hypothetical protein